MKDYAKGLYLSRAWREVREAYLASRYYLCERCSKPAEIVHHKRYITPQNITDMETTLAWDNLEALCRDCHAVEHQGTSLTADGLTFDDDGELIRCPRSGGKI